MYQWIYLKLILYFSYWTSYTFWSVEHGSLIHTEAMLNNILLYGIHTHHTHISVVTIRFFSAPVLMQLLSKIVASASVFQLVRMFCKASQSFSCFSFFVWAARFITPDTWFSVFGFLKPHIQYIDYIGGNIRAEVLLRAAWCYWCYWDMNTWPSFTCNTALTTER